MAQRQLRRDIKILFDEAGINIPFPQVVVHQG
jgi:small-conductance mechanosensitive channel